MKKFSNISEIGKVIVNQFWDHTFPRLMNKEVHKNDTK